MKKLLIIALLLIGLFFMPRPTVNADSIDYGSDWTLTQISGNVWMFELDIPFDITLLSSIVFNISFPAAQYSVVKDSTDTYFSSITVYDGVTELKTWTFSELMTPGGTLTGGIAPGLINVIIAQRQPTGLRVLNTFRSAPEILDGDSLHIQIIQVFPTASAPSGYENEWIEDGQFLVDISSLYINFYSTLNLFRRINVYDTVVNVLDPNPPTGFIFAYWRLSNGTILDLNDLSNIPESLIFTDADGVLYFNAYAAFASVYNPDIIYDPFVNDEAPEGLSALLAAFGFDNDAGRSILFFLIAFVVAVAMLMVPAFRGAPFVIVLIEAVLTAVWMFLGWLPVWVSIIVLGILLVAALWTLDIRVGGGAENE